MHVTELWRYPVKSLQGERLESAELTADGIPGDRRYAIYDVGTGFGLTGRRHPELLLASARLVEDGVEIALPDGSIAADDSELSAWLERPVALVSVGDLAERRYENPADFEHDAAWQEFVGAGGPFHDNAAARVSLVSTATIRAWDRRRFRPNVLLEGEGEDELVGSEVALGDARLEVGMRIGRCVMTTRPQPGLERDLDVLRTIARERDACLAVGALVTQPGTIRVGDALSA
jgi:uncharacterized protein